MLNAYYPVLYLTSFEYDRTKQKIDGIINLLRSEKKEVRLFNWNCVEGLNQISVDGQHQYLGEEYDDAEMVLKYIYNDKEMSKDIFILEDFSNYIEEEKVKFYVRSIAERAKHTNTHAIILSAVYKLPIELEKYVTVLNIPLPDRFDIERTLIQVERQCKINLSVEMRNRIVDAALGMTTIEADLAFCLAAVFLCWIPLETDLSIFEYATFNKSVAFSLSPALQAASTAFIEVLMLDLKLAFASLAFSLVLILFTCDLIFAIRFHLFHS